MRGGSTAMLVLAVGCGPIVAVEGDSTDDTVAPGEDEGDDRPGTGPSPSSSPTTLEDDDGRPEEGGEVDEGWQPDLPGDTRCSEAFIADCYEAITLEGYESEVLAIGVADVGGDAWPELVVLGEFWRAVHPGVAGVWGDATHTPHALATPTEVAFGDFVGDSSVDLLAIQPPYQAVFFERGDGQSGFYMPEWVDTPGLPSQLRVADIDADGADEAIAILGGQLVIVHEFDAVEPGLEIVDTPVFQVGTLAIGRLGLGDRADDLLVSGVSIDQILLAVAPYEAATAGLWEVHPFVPTSVGLTGRDFDLDGIVDIATASSQDTRALLYRWDPGGSLEVAVSIDLGAPTLAAAAGRFGPSAMGLVAIVDGVPTVADFVTGAATPLNGPLVQGPLVVQDCNGDGMDDIVARAHDGLSVVVHLSHD